MLAASIPNTWVTAAMQFSRLAHVQGLPCLATTTDAQCKFAHTSSVLPARLFHAVAQVRQDTNSLWAALISNPAEWYDCRQFKAEAGKPTFPDFKHSISHQGLWLQSQFSVVPQWVKEQLNNKLKDIPLYSHGQCGMKTDRKWSSLLSNPEEWRDCRPLKARTGRSSVADFRHAVSGSGLWLDDRAMPAGVVNKLSQLKIPLYDDQGMNEPPSLWNLLLSSPSEWRDCRQYKAQTGRSKFPDFKHAATDSALWLDGKNVPAWTQSRLAELNVPVYIQDQSRLWSSLISNPSEWQDCRQYKRNNGQAHMCDFRSTLTGMELWLSADNTPEWAFKRLVNVQVPLYQGLKTREQQWKLLLANPTEWRDWRQYKQHTGKMSLPDFRHAGDGNLRLWLGTSTPAGVTEVLTRTHIPLADPSTIKDSEPLWSSLLSNPLEWRDYRQYKAQTRKSTMYDFRHATSGKRLWIKSSTQTDILDVLSKLQVPAYVPSERDESSCSLWTALLSNPAEWRDCRQYKAQTGKTTFPDFVQLRDKAAALWLGSITTPKDMTAEISKLQIPLYETPQKDASHRWNSLLSTPAEWRDCRPYKAQSGRKSFPDFVRPDDKSAGLWLDSKSAPKGIDVEVEKLQIPLYESTFEAHDNVDAVDATWRALFHINMDWRDCRQFKQQSNRPDFPDFKQLSTEVGLWLSGASTPTWVHEMLTRVQVPLYAPKGAD